ncbi:hypothetical protein N2152v2_002443 [Parachlorella kessleri]
MQDGYLYVGNLAYEVSEQQLIDYFAQVGPVKNIRIVTERETGKPRGFGFIEFYDIPTAESAIRNLNGSELMGRAMRIVFAEGGPPGEGGGFRPRRDREDDRHGERFGGDRFGDDRSRRPVRNRMVGADLAYHASHGMSTLLGQPAQPGAPADATSVMLARKTRQELWEYLNQMKSLVQQNPQQARQILVQNPQLTKALFQTEIILGLVANPLGDVAPKGIAPPDMFPRAPHFGGGGGGGPAPGQLPPQQQQAPGPGPLVGMLEPQPLQAGLLQQQGPPLQYLPQQPGALSMAPPGPNGVPMAGYAPGPQPGQVLQAPPGMAPQQLPPGYILAPTPQPMQPYAPAPLAPQLAPAPVDPRMAAAPVDPRAARQQGLGVPQQQPQVVAGLQQQQQQPLAGQAQLGAAQQQAGQGQGMTAETQQQLLQQVMNLTPQQIELLPPQQKAQVLALQQQMVGWGTA